MVVNIKIQRFKVQGFKGSGLWVQGSGFEVQGFWVQGSLLPLAWKAASQIEKETLKKRILQRRINIEYRIMNIECRSNEFCLFYKKRLSDLSGRSRRRSLKRFHTSSFEISCSIFCGSLFQLCVVSHEVSERVAGFIPARSLAIIIDKLT